MIQDISSALSGEYDSYLDIVRSANMILFALLSASLLLSLFDL